MAAPFVDERAAGVAPAMRRRIAAALDAGERPALRGKNLRLGSIVLQRADGRDAPALREVELQMTRRTIDPAGAFETFRGSTSRRDRNIYAVDAAGQERIIARRVRGENRATQAGKRFWKQSYSRFIVHVPTYRVRRNTGARFHEDHYDVTGEQIGSGRRAERPRNAAGAARPAEPRVRRLGRQRESRGRARAAIRLRLERRAVRRHR